MGKIESTIKQEINRIAKKQAREAVTPLKAEIRRLKDKCSSLGDDITRLKRQMDSDKVKQRAAKMVDTAVADASSIRMSGSLIKSLRKRLKINQAELGQLVGVSLGSVTGWETDKFAPRAETKARIAALRKMSGRDVKKLL